MFARPVSLTYSGIYKFKTSVGAVFSIICVIMSLGYAVFRSVPLFSNENTSSTMNTLPLSDSNEFFKNGTTGEHYQNGRAIKPNVTFAIGMDKGALDPKYGKFEVFEWDHDHSVNKENEGKKNPLALEKCSGEMLKTMQGYHDNPLDLFCLSNYTDYEL